MEHGIYKKYGAEHLSIIERAVNMGVPTSQAEIDNVFRLARLGEWTERKQSLLEDLLKKERDYRATLAWCELQSIIARPDASS